MQSLQTKLSQLMQTLQLDSAPAGGALVVFHDGELIADCSVGQATKDHQWHSDTLSLNYSTGKGVLVTLVHILVSQDLLNYDISLVNYWPGFAGDQLNDACKKAKQAITLRDVLTHRADLFNIQSITESAEDILDWQAMLSKIEQMPLEKPRNQEVESCYSALVSGWVLGGLIEKATDLTLNDALAKYLAKPLGVEGELMFGVPASQTDQIATMVNYFDSKPWENPPVKLDEAGSKKKSSKPKLKTDSDEVVAAYKTLPSYECWAELIKQHEAQEQGTNVLDSSGYKDGLRLTTPDIVKLYFEMGSINLIDYKNALWPSGKDQLNYLEPRVLMAKIPAANGVASARALAKMYAMLSNKGVWQGKQLISESVFDELSKVYVTGRDAIMAAATPPSMHWRLGYHRLFSRCNRADNTFGHMGYDGSAAWCDTDRKLGVAFVHNYKAIMSTDIRQFAINEAILQWVDEQL